MPDEISQTSRYWNSVRFYFKMGDVAEAKITKDHLCNHINLWSFYTYFTVYSNEKRPSQSRAHFPVPSGYFTGPLIGQFYEFLWSFIAQPLSTSAEWRDLEEGWNVNSLMARGCSLIFKCVTYKHISAPDICISISYKNTGRWIPHGFIAVKSKPVGVMASC